MKRENIIRAWKDAAYRASLSEAERSHLPENPAGAIELDSSALGEAAGGACNQTMTRTCNSYCTWSCTTKECDCIIHPR
jgi:mersacidin/lichenicidin family type 2 lantibiotic